MKTAAIVVTAPGRMEMMNVEVPPPGPGEVLVETVASCVSPGTERRCLSGRGEAAVFPYVGGYCQAGIVTECGPGTSVRRGARVFSGGTGRCSANVCWGAHIAHAVTAESALHAVPDSLSLMEAAAARLAAIAYHGTRFSRPAPGRNIAVAGLGPIGQLSARIHHALGADVTGGDRIAARVALLQAAGVRAVNTVEGIRSAFAAGLPEGADAVVDATGAAELIPDIMGLAKELPWSGNPGEGARYIVQGSYADEVSLPYMDAFQKELTFCFSRHTLPSDMQAVFDLIAAGRLRIRDVISRVYAPDQAAEAFADLSRPEEFPGTAVFEWKRGVF